MTDPRADGLGVSTCIELALKDAGIEKEQVGLPAAGLCVVPLMPSQAAQTGFPCSCAAASLWAITGDCFVPSPLPIFVPILSRSLRS
jgi:hypothetical protein